MRFKFRPSGLTQDQFEAIVETAAWVVLITGLALVLPVYL